ncbi:hypothetical protein EJB05_27899, partial [Eragrostis curvula]
MPVPVLSYPFPIPSRTSSAAIAARRRRRRNSSSHSSSTTRPSPHLNPTGNELEGDLLHDQTCSASICRIPSVCEADAHDSKSSCSSNIVGVMGVDMDNNMMTRVCTWLNLVFLVLDLLLVTM